ncbi:hypothetical protein [Paludisphaera rhizosphaerae]|uniref:hypothetical protein n=1 Tax=Paludisphaera rhizosphaerae TaxID=2711216 RepID=UPI0013ECA2F3|nr:hypothetical protein [Paludisphaera rhizosphaerae]
MRNSLGRILRLLTVCRLMLLVAIVAMACELEVWRRRHPYCLDQAARYDAAAKGHLWLAESHDRMASRYRQPPADLVQSAIYKSASWREQARAESAAEQGRAFRHAANYPWLALPPECVDPMRAPHTEHPEDR